MAELTATTFVSLDGVMQAPGGPTEDPSGGFALGGWVFPLADPVMGETIVDNFSRADAFLLGRGTYDIFAAHWPRFPHPEDPIAKALNSLPKYVASRTQRTFEWSGTTLVRDVVAEAANLKQRYGREVQVHGSAGLLQTLIRHDLVDEYRIMVFPVVLGTGKRLFGSGAVPAMLSLVSSKTTSTGAVISVYRRGGALKTGSFALE
jgi:dihydrofolate reductase